MYDTTHPVDHARQYLTGLIPHHAQWCEEASDVEIKDCVNGCYAGGWDAFLSAHNGRA